jgi:hypothetical protein
MLFVVGMEVLTAMVTKAADEGIFKRLARIKPLQRISVYADAVVIFLRPEFAELTAIREILCIFGGASGLEVNYRKTTATLIRGNEEQEEGVRERLNCQIVNFPIRYLGLQLALRPLTRAEWQPMLDGVFTLIPAWQRGLIQRASRLMLIKTVIAARPIYHILVSKLPDWLLEEIAKFLRAFFWAGKKKLPEGNAWWLGTVSVSLPGLEGLV